MARFVLLLILLFIQQLLSAQYNFKKVWGNQRVDFGNAIESTADSGFVLAGFSDINSNKILYGEIIKLNKFGDTVWIRRLGDGIFNTIAEDVRVLENGDILVLAASGSDLHLFKLSSEGIIKWERKYKGTTLNARNSIDTAIGGGYIFLARKYLSGKEYVYLLNTTEDGDSSQSFYFDKKDTVAYALKNTGDAYVIVGTISLSKYFLMKFDPKGKRLWTKVSEAGYYKVLSMDLSADKGIVLTGLTRMHDSGATDAVLIKADPNGELEWIKSYGDNGSDYCFSVRQTADGGYALAGAYGQWASQDYQPDFYLIKTDAKGNKLWSKTYEGTAVYDLSLCKDGGYALFGVDGSTYNTWQYQLVKTDKNGEISNTQDVPKPLFVYPNPVEDYLYLSSIEGISVLKIYNAIGEQILMLSNPLNNELNLSAFCPGFYYMHVQTQAGLSVFKIVKE